MEPRGAPASPHGFATRYATSRRHALLSVALVTSRWLWGAAFAEGAGAAAVFDYAVVGAGASGCAVAARLALAGHRVVLVEAGGEPGLLSEIPNAAMALTGSHLDWFYETTSNNKSCLALRDGMCRFSRGRCLGGSTSINYMLYTRGNPRDYDFDIPGWSWPDLRPYFLRYEGLKSLNYLPPSSYPYHNTSGEVAISLFDRSNNPWNQRVVQGFTALKFPYNLDVNAESQIGVSRVLGYVSGGERVSAATAYLRLRDVGEKLKIVKNTRCTGVIVDANNEARGVTVVGGIDNKKTMKLYVKNDVILSAGTIGSAQLLMLSGIGTADHLHRMGIPVRVDAPVGDGMSDQVLPLLFIKVDRAANVTAAAEALYTLGLKTLDIAQWVVTRSGPFASLGVTDVVAFANTQCYDSRTRRLNGGHGCDVPNLQIIFAYVDRYLAHIVPRSFKQILGDEVFDQIFAVNAHSAFLIVSPILLRPKSKGTVRLASKDPLDPPVITPNYLDDETDVNDIVKSVEIVEQLVETPPFRQNNASLLKIRLRACPYDDRGGYWHCYVRHMTSSPHHAVGTAQLGKVVDERLRVRGVKRLHVGDASVLPEVPRGNTAAAALAVGERLADFLLEDNNSLNREQ